MNCVEYPIDKRQWSPGLIPGPIVLVATVNAAGVPNVAPKSWVQMVAFEPPMLMFSGSKGRSTENNIEATKCFSINVVNDAMLPSVLGCLAWRGVERIERSRWSLEPSRKISAPAVANAPAHLECELEDSVQKGSGLVIFGRIVAASLDQDIAEAADDERYGLLRQVCFLEDGVYATLHEAIGA